MCVGHGELAVHRTDFIALGSAYGRGLYIQALRAAYGFGCHTLFQASEVLAWMARIAEGRAAFTGNLANLMSTIVHDCTYTAVLQSLYRHALRAAYSIKTREGDKPINGHAALYARLVICIQHYDPYSIKARCPS